MATKIKVLGISASPRKGYNTDTAVQVALESAQMLGDWVETEFINVTKYKIKGCIACTKCYHGGTRERPCPGINDDMNTEIYPRLLAADAFIVGTPVYWGTLTSQCKAWMDRCLPFCHAANTELRGAMGTKVCGAIVAEWDRHGGAEVTAQCIQSWAHVLDITVAGAGHHHPHGGYLGGMVYTQPVWGTEAWRHDGFGSRSVRGTGKRTAELALYLKLGREAAKKAGAEYRKPAGKGDKIKIDWDKYFKVQPHFPTIHYRTPDVLGAGKQAMEKYIEWMQPDKLKEREGEAFGEKAGTLLDAKKFRDTFQNKLNTEMIDDEEMYKFDPEFFGPYLKK